MPYLNHHATRGWHGGAASTLGWRLIPCLIRIGLLLLVCCGPATLTAHPLGNSTVNRWAGLTVSAQGIDVDYVLDLAELPTLVETASADENGDGEVVPEEWNAHVRRWANGLRTDLHLDLDGRPTVLRLRNQRWVRKVGEAGLFTLRLEARYHAELSRTPAKPVVLDYRDTSPAGSIGWKEVVLQVGNGVSIQETNFPRVDRSDRLTAFPPGAGAGYSEVTSGSARLTLNPLARPVDAKTVTDPAWRPSSPAPAAQSETPQPSAPVLASKAAPNSHAADPAPRHRASILWSYFRLGVHHMASGWDHLLFLFGLLLLRLELRRILLVVTAFTLAHSLTLGIAAVGWVRPPSIWIEPGIALTIAYVGMLNLLMRSERHGILLAFVFGLIHGFGFAGALAESAATDALHGTDFLLSLASFNLGIETLQIALVLVAAPLLTLGARHVWFPGARRLAAAATSLTGLSVFILRLSGSA